MLYKDVLIFVCYVSLLKIKKTIKKNKNKLVIENIERRKIN